MAIRVNGGIINEQTVTGSMRYFKMVGPFAWTKSDGTVNLNVNSPGGSTPTNSYFRVGDGRPVPGSAAEQALREISKQASITMITLVPFAAAANGTTAIHFACSATGFGWGSNTPDYTTAPGAEDLTAAAPAMQVAVRALGTLTVPTGGTANQAATPTTTTADMTTVTITEVPFVLA